MLASDVTTRAARILSDTGNVRWTMPELLDYVSDAERAVVFFRPDANAVNEAVRLVGGTRQSIPASGQRLLRVVRNMGAAGTSPGRVIRECSRVALDNEQPDWHTAPTAGVAEHYVYDNVDPKRFYIYPCVSGTIGAPSNTYVEIVYAANPATVTTAGQTLTLGDQYLNPVLDWVLYRAYIKDAQYAGNLQRAQAHLGSFASALEVNMKQAFAAASPQAASPTPAAAPQVHGG